MTDIRTKELPTWTVALATTTAAALQAGFNYWQLYCKVGICLDNMIMLRIIPVCPVERSSTLLLFDTTVHR